MSKLDEFRINLEGIAGALSQQNLAVPLYQRDYAWEEHHVQELFTDLGEAIRNNESEYFLGSIVVTNSDSSDSDRFEVVDGQQRLATICTLIAAIRDHFDSTEDTRRARAIESAYLFKQDLLTLDIMPRLTLNASDNDFFRKAILLTNEDPEHNITPSRRSHERIARAAAIARDLVKEIATRSEHPIEKLVDWIDYLRSKAKVVWVEVPDFASAFTIFETLNDRGLDLAISDLLKNRLFGLAQTRMEEVRNRWMSMVGALEAVDSESMIVTYIRHLWASQFGITREKDLYDNMRSRIKTQQSAVDFASQLESNARLYAAILNPTHEVWATYGPTASRYMQTLNDVRWEQVRPLILAVFNKFTPQDVQETLRVLVSIAVRLLIMGNMGAPSEKPVSQLAIGIRDGRIASAKQIVAEFDLVPNDSQFRTAFLNATVSKAIVARYLLRTLESQYGGSQEMVPNSNQEVVNLEHILPQSPSADWNHIDLETAREYCSRIGNLALMEGRANSALGNVGFADKKEQYRLSKFELTSSIAAYSVWGPTEISERQAKLADLAVKAWPITSAT